MIDESNLVDFEHDIGWAKVDDYIVWESAYCQCDGTCTCGA